MGGRGHQCGEVGVALMIIELCGHMYELSIEVTAYVKMSTRIKKIFCYNVMLV